MLLRPVADIVELVMGIPGVGRRVAEVLVAEVGLGDRILCHYSPPKGRVQHGMAQRMVRFSDLTNKIIEDDDAVVRIVVEQHPALGNGPVEIEAAEDEVELIRKGSPPFCALRARRRAYT